MNQTVVYPGDLIGGGYRHVESQWWHDIKNGMDNTHLLRKCDFLELIPDTGESCPGVATQSDHYFCIFGTSDGPSWYCTCYEHQGDYHFHCNPSDIMSVEQIREENTTPSVNIITNSLNFESDTIDKHVSETLKEADISTTKTDSQGEAKLLKTNKKVVNPGDLIGGGYKHDEYQWWHDIKDKMENKHILRKCDFIEEIPDNGESCPGVATHSDHYFCIFGTSDGPSWYCTCYEHQGDYHFHCNRDKMMSVEQVQGEDNAAMVVIHDTVLYENSNNKNASSGVSSFSSSGSSGMLAASLLNPNEKNKQDDKVGRSDTFDIGVGLLCGILAVVVIIVIHRRSRRGRYQYNKAIDYTLGGTTFPESAYPRSSRPPGVTLPINEKVLQRENSLIFV